MKYTENDITEGMKLRCTDNADYDFWTKGAIYTVEEDVYNDLVIRNDSNRKRQIDFILKYLNGETEVRFEIFKDEKEMKKYAKITKYTGLIYTDKESGLEIGKEYEIVSFEDDYTNDCRIYLNEENPHYFISEDQYELVEKEDQEDQEYPVATFKVDVKEVIQAKIDELRTEAEHISNKRNRMEWQMFNLNSKANKLEEVIETIKEFE